MRVLPMLRCPCCGKLSFFPNFAIRHKVEAFVLRIKGLGRGKGFRNTYERQTPKDLGKYWIKRLKEVIEYLESQEQSPTLRVELPKQTVHTLTKQTVKHLPQTEISSYGVSEMSASLSEKMENPLSTLPLMKTKTLNVPSSSVNLSLKTKDQ